METGKFTRVITTACLFILTCYFVFFNYHPLRSSDSGHHSFSPVSRPHSSISAPAGSIITVTQPASTVTVTETAVAEPTNAPYLHFLPPEEDRPVSDVTDSFTKYKGHDECKVSSLDLHMPFSPLCPDRKSVLRAMSGGGRPGFDEPYIPLGCDMRWYSSEEVCDILGRFQKVVIIGDSMLRHVTNALWILIRGDIKSGAMNEDLIKSSIAPEWRWICSCGGQFGRKMCSVLLFMKAEDAFKTIPDRMVCKPFSFDLEFIDGEEWPLSDEALGNFSAAFPQEKPIKPTPLFIENSLHNDANTTRTSAYMDQVVDKFKESISWFSDDDSHLYMPRLYSPSSSGGYQKYKWLEHQAQNPLAKFEREIQPIVEKKGFEFLGAHNMSITASSTDGTHQTLEGNLLKAQMFLNWLDNLELPKVPELESSGQRRSIR